MPVAVSAPVSCSALEGQAEGPVVAARGMEEISRFSPSGKASGARVEGAEEPEKGSQEDHDDGCEEEGGSAAGTAVCCAGWGIWLWGVVAGCCCCCCWTAGAAGGGTTGVVKACSGDGVVEPPAAAVASCAAFACLACSNHSSRVLWSTGHLSSLPAAPACPAISFILIVRIKWVRLSGEVLVVDICCEVYTDSRDPL